MTQTVAAGQPPRRGLSPGAVAWIVAAASGSFVAFLAALAYQPELSAGSDKGAHALSRSPIGFAGLVQLLKADGAEVGLNTRRDPGTTVGGEALLVLTPTAATSPQAVAKLAHGRRVLLVLPKWEAGPDPVRRGRVMKAGVSPPEAATRLALAVLAPGGRGREAQLTTDGDGPPQALTVAAIAGSHDLGDAVATVKPIAQLRTLGGSAADPVIVDGKGRALVAIAHDTVQQVVADPDLLNNQGVADLQGARTAVSLMEGLADGGPIVFDVTLPGLAGARSPLKLAFAPPFLPATACGLVLAGLLGLMARGRFGATRRTARVYGFGKRALADSAASLLAVAGREPRLAGRYGEVVRASAVAAAGIAPEADRAEQDLALDRIGLDRGAGAWSRIAADAGAVKTPAQLMALARRADAWRMEMTRGRG